MAQASWSCGARACLRPLLQMAVTASGQLADAMLNISADFTSQGAGRLQAAFLGSAATMLPDAQIATSNSEAIASDLEGGHAGLFGPISCLRQEAWPPPPESATDYNGMTWPELCYEGPQEEHFFLIGDYGGVLRSVMKQVGIVWTANNVWDTRKHKDGGRRFRYGEDDAAQRRVALRMKERANVTSPRFVLNAGDNFYWAGIEIPCGHHMAVVHEATRYAFDRVFESVYDGPLSRVLWLSTLGNHDYGGFVFNRAWDQQIAYTWAHGTNGRWVLPALYWHQRVRYPAKNFTLDLYMCDSNIGDAHWPGCSTHSASACS
eukprot:TRINITY_DN24809_c0_g2_i2.p1 TRINITY_DN24809_c0_g2~~TRINITY_DN24809_c0_g2_i2.p1  ORF type:complete len:319 (-),score=49.95 TRINITY_DN24809_c0_g2_i2:38-994(-)